MFKEDGSNEFKMKVKIFKSSHNDLYFILHRERAMEKLEKEREKKKQAISNITSRIIPHDQRDLFKDQLFRPVAAENVLILSCRFINFEVGTEESVEGTLDSMTKYNHAIIKASKEIDDCCISKKHNTMTFILFNTKSQKRQLKSSFQDISKFVKEVYADCKEQGISVSFALTFSKNLIMGSLSQNRSQFNLYSPDLYANYTISRCAPDGYVYIQKLLNDLPPSLKEKIQPVDNTDIEVVNKVKVEDFSSE